MPVSRGSNREAGNPPGGRLSDLSLGDVAAALVGTRDVLRNIPSTSHAPTSSHASRSGLPRTTERLTTRARSVPKIRHRPPTRHSQSTCFVWPANRSLRRPPSRFALWWATFARDRERRLEGTMKRSVQPESFQNQIDQQSVAQAPSMDRGLPNRLLTAFEVAEFVGCHQETVRRAYLRGLLTSQRFGVRGRRFLPADVLDWIRRGAPTKPS